MVDQKDKNDEAELLEGKEISTEKDSGETTGTNHSPDTPTPNVIFIGTRRRQGKVERLEEAPKKLISGPTTFTKLPSSEEQLAGFYYEQAAELCRAFPGLYKQLIKKGE